MPIDPRSPWCRRSRNASPNLARAPVVVIAAIATAAAATAALAAEPLRDNPARAAATPASSAIAQVGRAPTTDQIEAWIADLGHDDFAIRRAAEEKLVDAGGAALAPLAEVSDGPDPETRAAARRLLVLIDKSEFDRTLRDFAIDVEGHRGLTLSGWEAFQEMAGSDLPARQLFVEIQRHERRLLARVFGDDPQLPEGYWQERMARLLQWQVAPQSGMYNGRTTGGQSGGPPLGSCAAMLFLSCVREREEAQVAADLPPGLQLDGQLFSIRVGFSDQAAAYVMQLIQRSPMREALESGEHREALRRLIVTWTVDSPNISEQSLHRRLHMASLLKLTEATPLALDVATGEPAYATVQPTTRALAILVVGQLGGQQHLDRLEPLLDDTSVCMQVRSVNAAGHAVVGNVQVRDAALAVMLHLTDQEPGIYGFVNLRRHPQQLFNLATLHMEDDEQRTKAAAKWREWRAAAGQPSANSDE